LSRLGPTNGKTSTTSAIGTMRGDLVTGVIVLMITPKPKRFFDC
jgi:hypothetical protein